MGKLAEKLPPNRHMCRYDQRERRNKQNKKKTIDTPTCWRWTIFSHSWIAYYSFATADYPFCCYATMLTTMFVCVSSSHGSSNAYAYNNSNKKKPPLAREATKPHTKSTFAFNDLGVRQCNGFLTPASIAGRMHECVCVCVSFSIASLSPYTLQTTLMLVLCDGFLGSKLFLPRSTRAVSSGVVFFFINGLARACVCQCAGFFYNLEG